MLVTGQCGRYGIEVIIDLPAKDGSTSWSSSAGCRPRIARNACVPKSVHTVRVRPTAKFGLNAHNQVPLPATIRFSTIIALHKNNVSGSHISNCFYRERASRTYFFYSVMFGDRGSREVFSSSPESESTQHAVRSLLTRFCEVLLHVNVPILTHHCLILVWLKPFICGLRATHEQLRSPLALGEGGEESVFAFLTSETQ